MEQAASLCSGIARTPDKNRLTHIRALRVPSPDVDDNIRPGFSRDQQGASSSKHQKQVTNMLVCWSSGFNHLQR